MLPQQQAPRPRPRHPQARVRASPRPTRRALTRRGATGLWGCACPARRLWESSLRRPLLSSRARCKLGSMRLWLDGSGKWRWRCCDECRLLGSRTFSDILYTSNTIGHNSVGICRTDPLVNRCRPASAIQPLGYVLAFCNCNSRVIDRWTLRVLPSNFMRPPSSLGRDANNAAFTDRRAGHATPQQER